jgi:hypothetical protein
VALSAAAEAAAALSTAQLAGGHGHLETAILEAARQLAMPAQALLQPPVPAKEAGLAARGRAGLEEAESGQQRSLQRQRQQEQQQSQQGAQQQQAQAQQQQAQQQVPYSSLLQQYLSSTSKGCSSFTMHAAFNLVPTAAADLSLQAALLSLCRHIAACSNDTRAAALAHAAGMANTLAIAISSTQGSATASEARRCTSDAGEESDNDVPARSSTSGPAASPGAAAAEAAGALLTELAVHQGLKRDLAALLAPVLGPDSSSGEGELASAARLLAALAPAGAANSSSSSSGTATEQGEGLTSSSSSSRQAQQPAGSTAAVAASEGFCGLLVERGCMDALLLLARSRDEGCRAAGVGGLGLHALWSDTGHGSVHCPGIWARHELLADVDVDSLHCLVCRHSCMPSQWHATDPRTRAVATHRRAGHPRPGTARRPRRAQHAADVARGS